ncbi:MAG: type II secretion system protein GspD [Alphaproteobacteria bacterium]|nr:MAG: type II secretion system protein GspD [Alphaproteobacteria bacterium]
MDDTPVRSPPVRPNRPFGGMSHVHCRPKCRTSHRLVVHWGGILALFLGLAACAGARPDGELSPSTGAPVDLVPKVAATASQTQSDSGPGQAGAHSGNSGNTRKTDVLADLSPLSDDILLPIKESEIVRGTGVFARRITHKRSDVLIGEDGDVTLNFVNADIREVVDAVLGQALGLSYIIDPKVEGQVTARTSMPVPRQAVIPVLENILALNGAALTFQDGIYKVVTIQEAATGLTTPVVAPSREMRTRGFGIHVIPVRYASAQALSEVLRPFVGPGRVFRVDAARNLLIFAGTGPEAKDLIDMVRVFDVDWMAGMSFALFPVQVADAKAVVKDLETVFLQEGKSPLAGLVRFVPIERLNAVLVISPQPAYIDKAESWIERLDRGGEGAGRRIFVYHVQNGRASDLAEVLNKIFETTQAASQEVGTGLAPGLEPAAIGTPPASGKPDEAAATQPQAGAAADLRVSDTTGIGTISESGNIRIIADERNNALVILATTGEYRMIEATLKRLDITPLQVLIEVTIAEVTLNDDLRYGLQWFFNSGASSITFSTLSSGTVSSAFPGFSYALSAADARVILNALTEITDVRVISSPQLMVLDNQSARLQVGDEVPIATQTAVSVSDPQAPIVNSIEFRDTGVILEVTPRVNAGGLVTLEVLQEVSDVTETTTSDLNSPTIQQRSIRSTVAVQSGDTVALGGLIQDRNEESTSGLPLLSDIPIFGNLFKSTSNAKRRTELLVLITPRVVRDQREAQEVTEELRKRLTGISPLETKIKTPR